MCWNHVGSAMRRLLTEGEERAELCTGSRQAGDLDAGPEDRV